MYVSDCAEKIMKDMKARQNNECKALLLEAASAFTFIDCARANMLLPAALRLPLASRSRSRAGFGLHCRLDRLTWTDSTHSTRLHVLLALDPDPSARPPSFCHAISLNQSHLFINDGGSTSTGTSDHVGRSGPVPAAPVLGPRDVGRGSITWRGVRRPVRPQ
jgi:hypothetical protein